MRPYVELVSKKRVVETENAVMEMNRNQYFFLAVFLLLIGMQLRLVSNYVLTPQATRFLAERANATATLAGTASVLPANLPAKVVTPHRPGWVGALSRWERSSSSIVLPCDGQEADADRCYLAYLTRGR